MQQRPTCTNVRIRSTRDAHKIFYAVQLRMLPMITRRLDADERLALSSGCIYAWEERGPHTEITGLGIERFTEGRRWSPSRVRDEFLFYYEKYTPPADAGHSGSSDKQPPRDWDPLVKQTYSVWVETDKGRRKWHLTAYFTQATVDELGTIDNIPGVADLVVPEGTFQSTRVGKTRKGEDSRSRSDVLKTTNSTVTRTYAPFPTAYSSQPSHYPNSPQSSYSQSDDPYRSGLGQPTQQFRPPISDIPQYSVPPPPPPPSLPPLRPSYDDDYKYRRPSLPTIPQSEHSSAFYGRRSSADYSASGTIPPLARTRTDTSLKPFAEYHASNDHHGSSPAFGASMNYPHTSSSSTSGAHRASEDPYSSRPSFSCSFNVRPSHSPPPSPSYHSASFPSPHNTPHILLPPPAQLFRSDPPPQYEVASAADPSSIGPQRVGLAPLHSLQRSHPYKRDPVDDRALRLLGPRSG
ncbi:Gti1/Pac2 family-domain-containing protein [Suillus clintonianus]|uniref:Gti1/Pac2 family-domain-containing protein n=1 Tax=Suillus clintonianus TaxID=1904413 RepID=UPI001B876AB8|nr:Gti1/Pac2 family-domain-containing protein [Suillus clintonianus]KAG2112077.1 Gti1/Pac2 family-domain-containing protein [Suillus clintonianus]